MAGDLGPARYVTRCRRLSGDDVLTMAPCQFASELVTVADHPGENNQQ
jgi:hypothetical protein